ncbi:MAG: betaine--homocysteine S-methyltransferase [Granulosicoccus sp.]|nr:betaine--homocysteine S-methyltransferase [Granulosicoccus sp.]
MSNASILDQHLAEKGILLADGATGTNLFAMGLQTGDSPELWNVDHPERIEKLYRDFIDAGSDLILTNTFGGTHFRLGLHGAEKRVHELNHQAAVIARNEVAKSGRSVIVAGSMGPTGEILEPNGEVSVAAATEAFAEQAVALKEGGADILWLETLSSKEEIVAAVTGAAVTELPIVYTVSIDTNGRTMMGVTAQDVINIKNDLTHPVAAVGTNCGVGAAEVVVAIVNLKTAADNVDTNPILVAKANCGIPEFVDGKIVYNGTPEIMHEYVLLAANAGAKIIGGCCGTTPEHIRTMRKALDNRLPGPSPELETIVNTLGEVSRGATAQFHGEMGVEAGSASGRGARVSRRRSKSRPTNR